MPLDLSTLRTIPVVDVMAMAGIARVDQAGGAPLRSGDVRSPYRTNIDRSGIAVPGDASELWRYSVALLRLRGL